MPNRHSLRTFKDDRYIDKKKLTKEERDELEPTGSPRMVTRLSYKEVSRKEERAVDVIDADGNRKVLVGDETDPSDGEVDDRTAREYGGGKQRANEPTEKKSHHRHRRHKSHREPDTGTSGRQRRSKDKHHTGTSGRPDEPRRKHKHRTEEPERSRNSHRKHHTEGPERHPSKSPKREPSEHGSQKLESQSELSESSDAESGISEHQSEHHQLEHPEIVGPEVVVPEIVYPDSDGDGGSDILEGSQLEQGDPEIPVGDASGYVSEDSQSKHRSKKSKSKHHKSARPESAHTKSQVQSRRSSIAPTISKADSHRNPLPKPSSDYASSSASKPRNAHRSHRSSRLGHDTSPPASEATESIVSKARGYERTTGEEFREAAIEVGSKLLKRGVEKLKHRLQNPGESTSPLRIQSDHGGSRPHSKIGRVKPAKSQPSSSRHRNERPGYKTQGYHSDYSDEPGPGPGTGSSGGQLIMSNMGNLKELELEEKLNRWK